MFDKRNSIQSSTSQGSPLSTPTVLGASDARTAATLAGSEYPRRTSDTPTPCADGWHQLLAAGHDSNQAFYSAVPFSLYNTMQGSQRSSTFVEEAGESLSRKRQRTSSAGRKSEIETRTVTRNLTKTRRLTGDSVGNNDSSAPATTITLQTPSTTATTDVPIIVDDEGAVVVGGGPSCFKDSGEAAGLCVWDCRRDKVVVVIVGIVWLIGTTSGAQQHGIDDCNFKQTALIALDAKHGWMFDMVLLAL